MVSIGARVERVKDDLALLIDPQVVARACLAAGYRSRTRCLDPTATLTAFAAQIAHGNTAISHVTRLLGQTFSESAYCQARARLPLRVVQDVFDEFTSRLLTALKPTDLTSSLDGRWCGLRPVLIDGTGIVMPDTPALREFFGTSHTSAPGCGLPLASVLMTFDARTDLVTGMHAAPAQTGDLKHVHELHPSLKPGDVLVGDRAFCSYVHLAMLSEAGTHGVFRMSASRHMPFPAKTGEGERHSHDQHRCQEPRLVTMISQDDQVVEIVKPRNRPKHIDAETFAKIPSKMTVRAVRYRVEQPGWRTHEITLMTNLLDSATYSAADLAALYLSRWRIEVNFRHLKRTLGMDRLKCQSLDGVKRELLMFALVYNAVCAVRTLAAMAQNAALPRVSFVDALRCLVVNASDGVITLLDPGEIKLWPLRPPRSHPRKLKRSNSQYPIMKTPRHQPATPKPEMTKPAN